jgi:zinc protease
MIALRALGTSLLLSLAAALPLRAELPIVETVSPGGIAAWLVEEPAIPFVALELRFRGGASLDPEGSEGAVALMTYLLEEGAGPYDAVGFAEATESLAARFRFSVDSDTVAISARFLSENRDDAVELLRLALTEPAFGAEDLERVRAQVISGLRGAARNPGTIASETFAALAYAGHPYAIPSDGKEATVAALTESDLRAAHAAALARDRVVVAAVGDIDAESLGLMLDRLLDGLPATGAPMPPPVEGTIAPGLTVVPFDGPQSHIVFGHAGPARDDPDFLTAFVLNEVLGGGRFSSRLMRTLREERGLTYGAYSYLAPRALGATMQGGFSTGHGNVAEAIALVREVWAGMAQEALGAEELARIVTYLTGEYPLRFDSNAAIARILVSMQLQGLPSDYVRERNALVEAVTVEEAARVARRFFDPEALHFVVVGRPEGLDSDS